jgi:hypothetical protein
MVVRWKDDNRDWSKPHDVSLGVKGDRYIVAKIFPRGIYRTRQWEITHADSEEFVIASAEEDFEVMVT